MESEITRLVYQHDKDLYRGNGLPGITTRMAAVEGNIRDMLKREDERKAQGARIELAVYVAVIAAVANFIAGRMGH